MQVIKVALLAHSARIPDAVPAPDVVEAPDDNWGCTECGIEHDSKQALSAHMANHHLKLRAARAKLQASLALFACVDLEAGLGAVGQNQLGRRGSLPSIAGCLRINVNPLRSEQVIRIHHD